MVIEGWQKIKKKQIKLNIALKYAVRMQHESALNIYTSLNNNLT